jgi:hypothetical protein
MPHYSEAIARAAYRFMGAAFVIALIANVTKHGFHLSGVVWPILLSGSMFILGMQPRSAMRESGKWATLYSATWLSVLFLFGTIIYQRFSGSLPVG